MRISQRLALAALAPALMSLVAILGVLLSFYTVTGLQARQAALIQMRGDVSELSELGRSYLAGHDERSRRQFLALSDQTESAIAAAKSGNPRYDRSLDEIADNVRSAKSLFLRVVEANARTPSPEAGASEAEKLLSGQLFLRLRDANSEVGRLVRTLSADIVARERRIYLGVTAFTILVAAVLTAGLLGLRSTITRSLRVLGAGTEAIGAGDLDYRIGMTSSDELGELGRSFDRMSERLKGVTVSKDEAERVAEERRRAEQRAKLELETSALLLEAAHSLATTIDLGELLTTLVEIAATATVHSRTFIAMWDETSGRLGYGAAAGVMVPAPDFSLDVDDASPGIRAAIETRRRAIVDFDSVEESGTPIADAWESRLALLCPVVFHDRLLALIIVDDPGERRPFAEREVAVVEGLASQAAAAIVNARLFETERESSAVTEALTRIDQSIHATLELDEMLRRVAAESAHAIGADGTMLTLKEGDAWVVRYAFNMPEDLIGRRLTVDQVPFIAAAVDTERPVAIDDAFDDPRTVLETQKTLGARAVMLTPLIVRDEVIGGLFFNYRNVHRFNPQHLRFAARLSASLGLALENARLYAVERNIADQLQGALLALPDEMAGIEFAHAYHSATEAARVGGDFYDVFAMGSDLVGITVGDVAGKGLDAAVLTSLVKNAIRAHASEKGATPGRILGLTNDVVYSATPAESFVTVFFGVLSRCDGRFVYSNAGHTTTALVRPDGSIAGLGVTGPILGGFRESEFEQNEARLGLDDLLFLYTDGLTEARRDGELLGEERAFEMLSGLKGARPSRAVDVVLKEVLLFAGGRLTDDMALLAVRRAPVDAGAAPPQDD